MTYILDKMSHPGWELKSDHIEHVRWMLEQHVCDNCKWTREDYDAWRLKGDPEIIDENELLEDGINPYNYCTFFPEKEEYKKLPDLEKIKLLLGTACGCEFDFIDSEDPDSGIKFVEIEND